MCLDFWRATITTSLGSEFRYHYPCEPIEYLRPIIANVLALRPTREQLETMETKMAQLSTSRHGADFYFSARLHQTFLLDENAPLVLRTLREGSDFYWKAPRLPNEPSWLNLA
jgi:hypothetical protein